MAVLPDPVCFFDGFVKTYTTKVQIDHVPAGVRHGMTAQVEILVDDLENVLSVPASAIVRFDEKDHVAVVKWDGGCEWRDVTLGRSNDRFAEVRAGIESGERVLLTPPYRSDEKSMDSIWKSVASEERRRNAGLLHADGRVTPDRVRRQGRNAALCRDPSPR